MRQDTAVQYNAPLSENYTVLACARLRLASLIGRGPLQTMRGGQATYLSCFRTSKPRYEKAQLSLSITTDLTVPSSTETVTLSTGKSVRQDATNRRRSLGGHQRLFNPFRTALPCWSQITWNDSAVYYVPSRSPRWTSGSPRMLLVLLREFESRRGEILNLFAKLKKGPTATSA